MLTRILLVEDAETVSVLMEQMLARLGYRVIASARSAEEAMASARLDRPDLALVDILLDGEKDGIQLAKDLRREMEIPTVFLTGHADEATLQNAKQAEPYGFLLKPVNRHVLRTTIEIAESKHKSELKAKRLELLLNATLSALGSAVFSIDAAGCVNYMNTEAERLTGLPWNDAHGRNYMQVVRTKRIASAECMGRSIGSALREGVHIAPLETITLLLPDDSEIEIDFSVSALRNPGGNIIGAVVSLRDVTEKRCIEINREEELKQQRDMYFERATRDSLTRLLNRESFLDRAEQTLREASRRRAKVGVLSIDMDNLKSFNDSMGHHAGDAAIKEFARRLRLVLRESDSAARLGGDEFAVLLPDIEGDESLSTVISRINDALSVPLAFEEHLLYLSASVGRAVFDRDGADTDALLRIADAEMYKVKRQRKGVQAADVPNSPLLDR